MKKILLIALIIVVFFSCSKKNDSSSSSSSIVGKWYVTTDSIAEYTNGTLSDHTTQTYDHTAYTIFNSDGSGSSVSPDPDENVNDTVKYTYTFSGKTLNLKFPSQNVAGGTIVAYSESVNVSVLTGSKLETQETESEVENGVTYKVFEQTDFGK